VRYKRVPAALAAGTLLHISGKLYNRSLAFLGLCRV
jgi:hypothetical protein